MDPTKQQGAPPPYPTQPPYPPTQPQYPYPPQPGVAAGPYPGAPLGPVPGGFAYGATPMPMPGGVPIQGQSALVHGVISGGYDSDVEGGAAAAGFNSGPGAFSDKAVRRGFIRKVYGILMIQLIITGLFIAMFLYVDSIKLFAMRNRYLYWVAFAIMMVCLISMACCESVRRKSPTNFIFLGVFTLCEGFMLGTITASFQVDAVLMAVGICAAVTLALTLFAFQTKYDFTTCGGMLCAMMVILMIAGIVMVFLPANKYAMIGYGSAGAIIFSMYIIYDTQLMMGGKHKLSISPEEYIFATLNLYLDIVNLFLYLLMIIGAAKSD